MSDTSAPPPPLVTRLAILLKAAATFDQALVDRAHWAVAAGPLVDVAHEFTEDDVALVGALSDVLKWALVVEGGLGHYEECGEDVCEQCATYMLAKRRMAEVITAARPALASASLRIGDIVEHDESGRRAVVTDVGSSPLQVRLDDGTRASWSSGIVTLVGHRPEEPRLTVDDRGGLWFGQDWMGTVDLGRKGRSLNVLGRLREALGQEG